MNSIFKFRYVGKLKFKISLVSDTTFNHDCSIIINYIKVEGKDITWSSEGNGDDEECFCYIDECIGTVHSIEFIEGKITGIDSPLFSSVDSISHMFKNIDISQVIAEDLRLLLSEGSNIKDASEMFLNSNLKVIPKRLFKNCPNITNLKNAFNYKLLEETNVPNKLLSYFKEPIPLEDVFYKEEDDFSYNDTFKNINEFDLGYHIVTLGNKPAKEVESFNFMLRGVSKIILSVFNSTTDIRYIEIYKDDILFRNISIEPLGKRNTKKVSITLGSEAVSEVYKIVPSKFLVIDQVYFSSGELSLISPLWKTVKNKNIFSSDCNISDTSLEIALNNIPTDKKYNNRGERFKFRVCEDDVIISISLENKTDFPKEISIVTSNEPNPKSIIVAPDETFNKILFINYAPLMNICIENGLDVISFKFIEGEIGKIDGCLWSSTRNCDNLFRNSLAFDPSTDELKTLFKRCENLTSCRYFIPHNYNDDKITLDIFKNCPKLETPINKLK